MRIIRPYGTSATEATAGDAAQRRRVLRRKPETPGVAAVTEPDLEAFATTHDRLVIAQWISTIDKIATKPAGFKKPGATQRALRHRLGAAAWRHIAANGLLQGLAETSSLETLWWMRLEPYPAGAAKYARDPKGRWYARFVGEVEPDEIDADAVVERIAEHLYAREHPIHAGLATRRKGRIAHRAASIQAGVPKAQPRAAQASWREEHWTIYAEAGDVAAAIRAAAEEVQAPPPPDDKAAKGKRRWVRPDVAGKALFEHWQQVFVHPETKAVLSVREVKARIDSGDERMGVLFELHEEVRGAYRRLLKRHRKAAPGASGKPTRTSDVARLLPSSMDALRGLLSTQRDNRDVNALIRFGKVIHYEAAEPTSAGPPDDDGRPRHDEPAHVLDNWPDAARVAASRFWTSDGQTEIKANEAFVRVWRRVLALMHRTATDWAMPEGDGDFTIERRLKRVVGEDFDQARHRRKVELLFGARAGLFRGDGAEDALDREVLRFALTCLRGLRNKSFHFVGLGGFKAALTGAKEEAPADGAAPAWAQDLWEQDQRERAQQLGKVLQGVRAGDYIEADELRTLFDALVAAMTTPSDLPLPRFKRVLLRAENIRDKDSDDPHLPEPANRLDLEDPARLCQYTALKLVYERPFRRWLAAADAAQVGGYVEAAARRATDAARQLNDPEDEDKRELVRAKAERIANLAPDATMREFVRTLMRETASEMRVQRGYESDAENARDQARYIEDLLRDVVAAAFLDYLQGSGLGFLLEIAAERTVDPAERLDPTTLEAPAADVSAEPWQVALYFVSHLAPVDDIALLLHQLRKFDILAEKRGAGTDDPLRAQVEAIIKVFDLYLDMHDAKFEGGRGLAGLEDFARLFESRELFEELVAKPVGQDDSERVPVRGLREIARYGHLPPLLPILQKRMITEDDAEEFREREGTIAARQKERQELHAKWASKPKAFTNHSVAEYTHALRDVALHRHGANHVMLAAHVRLHRLLMAVLGRLLDFSGLFERDLYFAALALVHENGSRAEEAFGERGADLLRQGRILAAVRQLEAGIREQLGGLFSLDRAAKAIRNDLAHFNMLQPSRTEPAPLDLTSEVNRCRQLMRYDRKLKNAVTKAVIEILEREGLDIRWAWNDAHELTAPTLKTRAAKHLGGRAIAERRDDGAVPDVKDGFPVQEALHAPGYVEMAAALFGGHARPIDNELCALDLDRIDWRRPRRPDGPKGKGRGKNRQPAPKKAQQAEARSAHMSTPEPAKQPPTQAPRGSSKHRRD